MKRMQDGAPEIRAAIDRVVARGRDPSFLTVNTEMRRSRGRGASRRDVLPVLRVWRDERLAACSGAIEAAVVAILALSTNLERDEVRRLVRERSHNAVRLKWTVSKRDTGGGRAKVKRLAAAGRAHTPLQGPHA